GPLVSDSHGVLPGCALATRARRSFKPLRTVCKSGFHTASMRSMKYTAPASRAPGVSSVGMMCAEIASMVVASAGFRTVKVGGSTPLITRDAWCAADTISGMRADNQAPPAIVPTVAKKLRRLKSVTRRLRGLKCPWHCSRVAPAPLTAQSGARAFRQMRSEHETNRGHAVHARANVGSDDAVPDFPAQRDRLRAA